MSDRRRYDLILSTYLTARGMAWVLFEGPYAPVDWSVIDLRGVRKSQRCMQRFETVLEKYRPEAVVFEDASPTKSNRSRRIRTLNERMRGHAVGQGHSVAQFTRADIQRSFAHLGAANKDAIARAISEQLPCFQQYLPPIRKPWMSEDARMGLFDATALAFLFYQGSIPHRKSSASGVE